MNRYLHTSLRTAIAIAAIAITASASANTRWNVDEVPQANTNYRNATIQGWFEVDEQHRLIDWEFETYDTINEPEDRFGNYYTSLNSAFQFPNYDYGVTVERVQLSYQDPYYTFPYRRSVLDLRIDLSSTGTTGSGYLFETDWHEFVSGSSILTHSGMFTVTAVPEPETLTMGLAGLVALAGAAARRRRASTKAAS